MFKYKKTIITTIILILIIGVVVYGRSRKPAVQYTTATVTKGELTQTVSTTGDLKDDSEIVLNFELGGRISKIFVKKNDKVAVGDPIATLENADLSGQVAQAKAALDKALADAGANNDIIHEAQVAVDNAKNSYDDTKDYQDQQVDAAETAYDNAKDYYDDALSLYNSDPTKTNKLTLTSAANNKKAAEEAVSTAKKSRDLAETQAQNSLDAAKAHLKTTQSDYTSNSKDATVASAKAGYDIALNNLGKSTLRAPVSGMIVEVNNKVGEILGTGVIKESFARIITDDLIIESNVPESDIVKLQLGQKAKITFDALPSSDEFDAQVIEIDPAETVIQDVVYYGVKLRLSNVDQRLKVGMSANIDVRTNDKADVLMMPLRAIKQINGEEFVDVLQADNTTKEVKVTTGLEGDEGMVEVKTGLNAGDKVVTFSKSA